MASTKNLLNYETGGAVTITTPSLATGSARESAVIDNSGTLALEDKITLTFTVASGSPSTAGSYVNIYAAGSPDGTLFPKVQLSAGGSYTTGAGDASVGALATPNNLRLLGSFGIQTTTSAGERTFITEPMSVAQAFDGVPPKKYSIIVDNQLGVAFSSSTTSTANAMRHDPVDTTSGN